MAKKTVTKTGAKHSSNKKRVTVPAAAEPAVKKPAAKRKRTKYDGIGEAPAESHAGALPHVSQASFLSTAEPEPEQSPADPAKPALTFQQRLFDLQAPQTVFGKNVDSLRNSRNQREDIVRMFDGRVPASVMLAKKASNMSGTDQAIGTYEATAGVLKTNNKTKIHSFRVSGGGVQAGALSMFPRNICKMCVLLYSKPGDTVVDPFAGHNSRMETCIVEGRHYTGYDISRRFMEYNFVLADQLRKEFHMTVDLYEDDSRLMRHTPDALGDFTITSPPYWDIEDYGDEAPQLGKLGDYAVFLDGLFEVAKQNFRTLKPGAFCCWFVNDFRRDGKFYAYHVDTLNLLLDAGFIHHDMLIVDFGNAFGEMFATQIIERRVLPKRHEYGLIMRKPE